MRFLAIAILALMSAGCTTQALGARCVQDTDCDTSVAVCRSELTPTEACAGSDCICVLIPTVDASLPTPDTTTGTDAASSTNPG